ncbi:hypothetical protein ScPMuIL_015356 [Solemya velum]
MFNNAPTSNSDTGSQFSTVEYPFEVSYYSASSYCRNFEFEGADVYTPISDTNSDVKAKKYQKSPAWLWSGKNIILDFEQISPTTCMAAEVSDSDVTFTESNCTVPKPYVCKFVVMDCGDPPV